MIKVDARRGTSAYSGKLTGERSPPRSVLPKVLASRSGKQDGKDWTGSTGWFKEDRR